MQLASQFAGLQTVENVGIQGSEGTDYLGLGTQIGSSLILASAMSDRNLKENLNPISRGLDILDGVSVYQYNFIATPSEDEIGIMAQDLQSTCPEAVTEIEGLLHVKPMVVVGLLINAVKELREKIDNMKGK